MNKHKQNAINNINSRIDQIEEKKINGISEIEDRDCEITPSENNNNNKSEIKPYMIYGRPWGKKAQIIKIREGKMREESESLFNE